MEPQRFLVRRAILSNFAPAYRIFDAEDNLVMHTRQNWGSATREIDCCANTEEREELLLLRGRWTFGLTSCFDVLDLRAGEKRIGVLRKVGFSLVSGTNWLLADAEENEIGMLRESNAQWAPLTFFAPILAPRQLTMIVDGETLWTCRECFSPLFRDLELEITAAGQARFDGRIAIAAALVL